MLETARIASSHRAHILRLRKLSVSYGKVLKIHGTLNPKGMQTVRAYGQVALERNAVLLGVEGGAAQLPEQAPLQPVGELDVAVVRLPRAAQPLQHLLPSKNRHQQPMQCSAAHYKVCKPYLRQNRHPEAGLG